MESTVLESHLHVHVKPTPEWCIKSDDQFSSSPVDIVHMQAYEVATRHWSSLDLRMTGYAALNANVNDRTISNLFFEEANVY